MRGCACPEPVRESTGEMTDRRIHFFCGWIVSRGRRIPRARTSEGIIRADPYYKDTLQTVCAKKGE